MNNRNLHVLSSPQPTNWFNVLMLLVKSPPHPYTSLTRRVPERVSHVSKFEYFRELPRLRFIGRKPPQQKTRQCSPSTCGKQVKEFRFSSGVSLCKLIDHRAILEHYHQSSKFAYSSCGGKRKKNKCKLMLFAKHRCLKWGENKT